MATQVARILIQRKSSNALSYFINLKATQIVKKECYLSKCHFTLYKQSINTSVLIILLPQVQLLTKTVKFREQEITKGVIRIGRREVPLGRIPILVTSTSLAMVLAYKGW